MERKEGEKSIKKPNSYGIPGRISIAWLRDLKCLSFKFNLRQCYNKYFEHKQQDKAISIAHVSNRVRCPLQSSVPQFSFFANMIKNLHSKRASKGATEAREDRNKNIQEFRILVAN